MVSEIFKGVAIGVIRPDSSGETLTKGLVESPTWAPNGRVLMFLEGPFGKRGANLSFFDRSYWL